MSQKQELEFIIIIITIIIRFFHLSKLRDM